MSPIDRKAQAREFLALHQNPPLLLPNAWDAGSAKAIESAGAKAIATTSAGVSWAAGLDDAGGLNRASALAALRQIVAAVSVPVTADIESGYGDTPAEVAETAAEVIDIGAVGINLEDSASGALVDPGVQAERIAAAREAAVGAGLDLCINARIDTYFFGDPAETASRAKLYTDAGADVLFVPGLLEPEAIRALVSEISLPLNLMVGPGAPTVAELVDLGVTRISLGPAITSAAYALAAAATTELLGPGTYRTLGTPTSSRQVHNER
ncbi:2-methylisocitrate lyase-like PEP mutase family enzyme [Kribbella sp. VKM Ac-2527]|uniref:2-methylisocitrate lyase-like PEP mutase family enzyme n=1 Tax=Kribbella caucasensis TaxID=2512215 RepID=A0A4R6KKI5_9ACTN|nr:isocitrate lyase/phosphoenolpyruvate mutase family protein [Kribbella sp. VKM Ac-2527]TDO49414.1 2-methylisocitrate lyase-like PEP mutase family enzyme [Kribbella sp. VKM Ac-2527]